MDNGRLVLTSVLKQTGLLHLQCTATALLTVQFRSDRHVMANNLSFEFELHAARMARGDGHTSVSE